MKPLLLLTASIIALLPSLQASALKTRPQVIDDRIEIGYGLAIADVDGDRRPDILLADAKQIVWYRAPDWQKFVIAENLTPKDNVCIAAADLDGDGRAEVAVGAEWNPGDTVNSGAIFLLEAPEDRTQRWKPVPLPHEPTTHRMRWMRDGYGHPFLAVLPLHGRGNKDNAGEGVQFLGYPWPWKPGLKPVPLHAGAPALHATHNFDLMVRSDGDAAIVGAKEGVFLMAPAGTRPFFSREAAGEVRLGHTKAGRFLATIEPMHGNRLAVYQMPAGADFPEPAKATRSVLTEDLVQGHAIAVGDLLGQGGEQIVVGWRGAGRPGDKGGLRLYAATDDTRKAWSLHTTIDDGAMACEDMKLADLNGDGRLDIIAAGRATKNVVIYWNEGTTP